MLSWVSELQPLRSRKIRALRVSAPEPVRPGDPDYALVRARRRDPAETLPIREIDARLTRLQRRSSRS